MNKTRLLLLADALERHVPREHFNLVDWRSKDGDEWHKVTDDELREYACGTAACAVGWACAMPQFQAEGLTWGIGACQPEFEGEASWDAVVRFFDIDEDDSNHLFAAFNYSSSDWRDPLVVAGRIRDYVEEHA